MRLYPYFNTHAFGQCAYFGKKVPVRLWLQVRFEHGISPNRTCSIVKRSYHFNLQDLMVFTTTSVCRLVWISPLRNFSRSSGRVLKDCLGAHNIHDHTRVVNSSKNVNVTFIYPRNSEEPWWTHYKVFVRRITIWRVGFCGWSSSKQIHRFPQVAIRRFINTSTDIHLCVSRKVPVVVSWLRQRQTLSLKVCGEKWA